MYKSIYSPFLWFGPGALSACWAADFSASLGVSLSSPAYSCTLGYHLSWSWQLEVGQSWPSMQFRRTMDWYLHSNTTKPFHCGFELKLQGPGERLSHPAMAIPPFFRYTVNNGAWWTMAATRLCSGGTACSRTLWSSTRYPSWWQDVRNTWRRLFTGQKLLVLRL